MRSRKPTVSREEYSWTRSISQFASIRLPNRLHHSSSSMRMRHANSLGHFAAARWQVNGQRRAEVLVSGEGLQRGARDVLGTLLHEAAHGLADIRGVKDTSRQGRYHNLKYARLAGEVGLDVACDPATGWSQTTVPEALAEAYADVLTDLAAALVLWRYAEQQRPTSTSSRNLLACACPCGRKLRVARQTLEQAPIVCGACEHPSRPV
jgi:hypothetical protein